MNTDRDKIIARIRDCMRVANNTAATEAEVETYMKYARKLMDTHNIEEAEAMSSDAGKQTAYDSIVDEIAYEKTQVFCHELMMASAVGYVCDVRSYVSKGHKRVHFFGLPTDVAVARVFYCELLITVKIMARAKYGQQWCADHFHYCDGFTSRVTERAAQMARDSQAPGLVLCKTAMLDRYQGAKLELETKALDSAVATQAFLDGRRDGDSFNLGVDRRIQTGRRLG